MKNGGAVLTPRHRGQTFPALYDHTSDKSDTQRKLCALPQAWIGFYKSVLCDFWPWPLRCYIHLSGGSLRPQHQVTRSQLLWVLKLSSCTFSVRPRRQSECLRRDISNWQIIGSLQKSKSLATTNKFKFGNKSSRTMKSSILWAIVFEKWFLTSSQNWRLWLKDLCFKDNFWQWVISFPLAALRRGVHARR